MRDSIWRGVLRASVILVTACGGSSSNSVGGASGAGPAAGQGAGPSSSTAPIIFNAPQSAQAGDIIYLQGENFGSAPAVMMQPSGSVAERRLRIVNQVGDWLAAEIPADAGAALAVRVVNGTLSSATVPLNAPVIYNLDSVATAPGGAFRIFGRNLMLAARTPRVDVDGVAATVDLTASDPEMLVVQAPLNLAQKQGAAVRVDNGGGLAPITADQMMEIVAGAGQTIFGGRAGWLAVFAPLLGRVAPVDCSGGRPVSRTIQVQADALAQSGGGVISLGPGVCTLDGSVSLPSHIVLQGAGQGATQLLYQADYPLSVEQKQVIAIRDLTLTNAGGASEGPILHKSAFLLLQNVTMNFGTQRQAFFDGNNNILVTGCTFNQTGSMNQQSPYLFSDSNGLIFENNVTRLVMGAAAFERARNSYVGKNLFRRDASRQDEAGALHMMTIDFASGIAIIGNVFDTVNGPITNRNRNDGEAILTEGGGSSRTESIGTVESAGPSSLTDSRFAVTPGPFVQPPDNYGIAIVAGKGAGQTRSVRNVSAAVLTVDRPWDSIPDAGSKYAAFVWGLQKALIKDNIFSQMPRGIWLYQAAIRQVLISGNHFLESGGIYLRAYQNLDTGMFDPIYNVDIQNNEVKNLTLSWPSYMTSVFVNADARAFGIAMLGIVFRDNSLLAHSPPFTLNSEEYAGNEGYFAMMRVENYTRYEPMTGPRVLGTIFQRNSCTDCEVGYRVGTGSGGTVISGARTLGSGKLFDNWKTTSSSEQAVNTVIE
ncbi:right-handed parallel beta-helix repeat-containing protein [Sphingobium mellinum]|uniref:hypothetical protein n=1 Tax=Sphingobium mellinum TaxID=1387166 RepID=UPI0030EDDCA4